MAWVCSSEQVFFLNQNQAKSISNIGDIVNMPRLLQLFRLIFPGGPTENLIPLSPFLHKNNLFNTATINLNQEISKIASEMCQLFLFRSYSFFNISKNVKLVPIFLWLVSSKETTNYLKGKRGAAWTKLWKINNISTVIKSIIFFWHQKEGLSLSYTFQSKKVEIILFFAC